ncbi:MAG: hypothetical protein J7452_00620 [Thermoflexus sp.]|jgi:hypothetical protein|nr:hypothetical protein [Thermoflexus sp.]
MSASEETVLFCEQTGCRAHKGVRVRRARLEEWRVGAKEGAPGFIVSGISPLCPFCGHRLLWPSERTEGTAPASREEMEELALWLSAPLD